MCVCARNLCAAKIISRNQDTQHTDSPFFFFLGNNVYDSACRARNVQFQVHRPIIIAPSPELNGLLCLPIQKGNPKICIGGSTYLYSTLLNAQICSRMLPGLDQVFQQEAAVPALCDGEYYLPVPTSQEGILR